MKKRDILFGLAAATVLAILIAPYASSWPDGLEKVAERFGFIQKGETDGALASPIPDYVMPGIKNERLATALAGLFGTFVVFGLGYGAAKIMARKKNASQLHRQI